MNAIQYDVTKLKCKFKNILIILLKKNQCVKKQLKIIYKWSKRLLKKFSNL